MPSAIQVSLIPADHGAKNSYAMPPLPDTSPVPAPAAVSFAQAFALLAQASAFISFGGPGRAESPSSHTELVERRRLDLRAALCSHALNYCMLAARPVQIGNNKALREDELIFVLALIATQLGTGIAPVPVRACVRWFHS